VAAAQLRITVKDPDERKVGKAFSSRLTELALASYPGFYGGASGGTSTYGVYWPALIPADLVWQEVVVGGERTLVESTKHSERDVPIPPAKPPAVAVPGGPTRRVPLGRIAGARSGDKGGNANIGVWGHTDEAYVWLADELTVDRLRELLVETSELEIERFELPNIRSLNFVVHGLLGEGVASSTRVDAQAKSLGEYLRAKVVDVPASLVGAR
jgi:hypothetical protein